MAAKKKRTASVQPHDVVEKPVEAKFRYASVCSLNDEQKHLIQQLYKNDVIVATGVAGSGKTHCCCGVAAEFLKRDLVEQLIISRPIVAAEEMGFLKGGYLEKSDPYTTPILNELDKFIDVKYYTNKNKILILPVAFMRGWNFSNSFVLIDESQNLCHHLIKLIVTRLCENSKLVFCGDSAQSDLDYKHNKDFYEFVQKTKLLANNPDNKVAVIELMRSVRHPLVEKFLSIL